jgi:Hint module
MSTSLRGGSSGGGGRGSSGGGGFSGNGRPSSGGGRSSSGGNSDSSSGGGSGKSCFAGLETVLLESGEVKVISAVRVGDRVLAADADRRFLFSEVVFIPHGANTDKALFTHITTTDGKDLKMTGSHILPAGHCDSHSPLQHVSASMVKTGDCVMTLSGMEKVSAVKMVKGQGLYTIITKDQYVVVNGIIASPFAYNHMMANFFTHPSPDCWSSLSFTQPMRYAILDAHDFIRQAVVCVLLVTCQLFFLIISAIIVSTF